MDSMQEAVSKWPSAWGRWLWAFPVFARHPERLHTGSTHRSTARDAKRRDSGARSEAQPSGVS
jgi:hypothetical protein